MQAFTGIYLRSHLVQTLDPSPPRLSTLTHTLGSRCLFDPPDPRNRQNKHLIVRTRSRRDSRNSEKRRSTCSLTETLNVMMSYSTAGPSRYPALATTSETGSASPSFSPIPEGHPSWAANGNGYGGAAPSANGHGDGGEGGRNGDAGSKRNPLVDLIDSEKAYVDQLALVIRVSTILWHRFKGQANLSSESQLRGPGKTSHHRSWIPCSDASRRSSGRTGGLAP